MISSTLTGTWAACGAVSDRRVTEDELSTAAARIEARAGFPVLTHERVLASLNRRLGSPLDGLLQVVSPRGFVMAENDDWVAMASEYRAIAVLPGAEQARTWEPEPGHVYSWSKVPA